MEILSVSRSHLFQVVILKCAIQMFLHSWSMFTIGRYTQIQIKCVSGVADTNCVSDVVDTNKCEWWCYYCVVLCLFHIVFVTVSLLDATMRGSLAYSMKKQI
jgi:hypothetical protein